MVAALPEQSSFNGGEWSPHLWGRQTGEVEASYNNSCREVTNFDVLVQGPARYRSGTRYIRREPDSTTAAKESRLVSFEFGTAQTYVVEFGDSVCRFYRDKTILTEAAKTITAATQANPCVVTSAAHGYSNGDEVFIAGVVGMTELNNRFFIVANVTTDTFELVGLNSTGYGAYSSAGEVSRLYKIASPYTAAQVWQIYSTQSADELYLAHPDVKPKKLVRNGDTNWAFVDLEFKDGPMGDQNTTDTTLTSSAATGSSTVTASSIVGINNGTGFQTTDVGRHVRIKSGSNWGWGIITARASTTSVTVDIKETVGTTATKDWRLGVISETTGYPEVVTFFSDRLTFFEIAGEPQGVFASKTGEYDNYALSNPAGEVFANSALSLYLSSNTVNKTRWAVPLGRDLIVGTSSTEWEIGANTAGEAFTAVTATARETTTLGSAAIPAVKINNTALFVAASERSVANIDYSINSNNFGANDMNLFANHLLRGGVRQIAYMREPENRLIVVAMDGRCYTMSYKPEQNVNGWTRLVTEGKVLSAAVVPSVTTKKNELYLLVERVIDGVTHKFTEVQEDPFDIYESLEDAHFLDSAAKYDGRSTPDASITSDASTGDVTITASASVFGSAAVDDDIRVGAQIARITSVNSATEIEATVLSDYSLPLSAASGDWELLGRIDSLDRLWHLEGKEISVLADGATHPNRTVANGTIELDDKYHVVHVGIGYTGRLVTRMFNDGSRIGTAQGLIKRFNAVILHLLDTLGGFIGGANYKLDEFEEMTELQFRTVDDRMDQSPRAKSGFFEEPWPTGYEREGSLVIEQRQPLPMTVQAVIPKVTTYEGR